MRPPRTNNSALGLAGVQPYCVKYGTCSNPAAQAAQPDNSGLGLAGVQPYCVPYGTCRTPQAASAGFGFARRRYGSAPRRGEGRGCERGDPRCDRSARDRPSHAKRHVRHRRHRE